MHLVAARRPDAAAMPAAVRTGSDRRYETEYAVQARGAQPRGLFASQVNGGPKDCVDHLRTSLQSLA